MNITFQVELTPEQQQYLSRVLACQEEDLENTLALYGRVALQEYIDMFFGEMSSNRGNDIHEYRLFLLIKEIFKEQLPDEQRISRLFCTTVTRGRSLVRSVLSRYSYELREEILNALIQVIESAEQKDNDYEVIIKNSNVVDVLNQMISDDGSLPKIMKKSGTTSKYCIKASAYTQLCQNLGIERQ